MFGAVFALLGILLVSIVVGSQMRTASSPIDQDARDAWMLVVALAALVAGGTAFGWMLRLPLAERSEESRTPDESGDGG